MNIQQEKFITSIAILVQKYAPQYNIKICSPIIAQAILESNWGESKLSKLYYNYFGMKCGSKWDGKSVNLSTGEQLKSGNYIKIKSDFRVYDSMEDGIKGYFDFIQLDRYKNLQGITNPKLYLETIKSDGYCTSIQYVENCMNVINSYNLTLYDNIQQEKKGDGTMQIIIGSARSNEKGGISHTNGIQKGDQKSGGEVSTQSFYVHNKGWYVLRPKDGNLATKIGERMAKACSNNNIGYCQDHRDDLRKYGIDTKVKTEVDCSALVRVCIEEASGKSIPNFNTSSEATTLENTGLFEKRVQYTNGMKLYVGDVLVTCTKGHTVIVTQGYSRTSIVTQQPMPTLKKTIDEIAQEVIDGKWGTSPNRKVNIENAGYNYQEVQNKVNAILKGEVETITYYPRYNGTSVSIVEALEKIGVEDVSKAHRKIIAQANGINNYTGQSNENLALVNLLKQGKLIHE